MFHRLLHNFGGSFVILLQIPAEFEIATYYNAFTPVPNGQIVAPSLMTEGQCPQCGANLHQQASFPSGHSIFCQSHGGIGVVIDYLAMYLISTVFQEINPRVTKVSPNFAHPEAM